MSWKYFYIALLIWCHLTISESKVEFIFDVKEEQEAGIIIGNISTNHMGVRPNGNSLSYKLLSEVPYVKLHEKSGYLYTTESKIDKEALCPNDKFINECILQLEAVVTSENYFQLCKIKINIADINDNAPYFSEKEIIVSIPEDAPVGASFGIDHYATDIDTGSNSVQNYFLENSDGAFSVKHEEGSLSIITEKLFDREVQDMYQLTIVAVDGGVPPLSGTSILIVNILDVNDNCPVFSSSGIHIAIPENASSNSLVAQLNASDADLGSNAEISCSHCDSVYQPIDKSAS
nr:PREDICTED: protocadherin-9-like [Latimeria chalumnae]|eukprot:XP_014347250.1 PREDICTED: protocadherin-9-like [Latimeria chalumnae]